MSTYYQLEIDQKIATKPGEQAYSIWEKENSKHKTKEDLVNRLEEIYRYEGGYNFIEGNEIYIDTEEGTQHIGYHYSYWTEIGDRSTGPKKGWATDWITIFHVSDQPATDILTPTAKTKAS